MEYRDADGFTGRGTEFTRAARSHGCGAPGSLDGAEKLGLEVGDRVVHDRFGPGVVTTVEGAGSHARAAVDFESTARSSWSSL